MRIGWARIVLALFSVALGIPPLAAAGKPARRAFSPESPFNKKIPPRTPTDPASQAAIRSLLAFGQTVNVNLGSWTPPVFVATKTSPVKSVQLPRGASVDVPVPSGAAPSTDTDGYLTIIDRPRGCTYDFFRAQQRGDGSWVAGGAAAFRLGGTGVHRPWGVRASGFALLAGLIRPSEVRANRIEHALVMGIPNTSPSFRAPATTSDGRTPGGIAMGSHFQLDPNFDVSRLPPDQRMIARAMQRYGVYIGDTSGAITLYAQNTASTSGFLYPDWANGLTLSQEIVGGLRLLRPTAAASLDKTPTARCAVAKRGHRKTGKY
jgi:hypothetical protein